MKSLIKSFLLAFSLMILSSQIVMAQSSSSACIDYVVIATETAPNCPGGSDGSATLVASGGAAPYTFEWSNNDMTSTSSGLSAGNYFATVTDAVGCVEVLVITIPDGSYDANPITGNPIPDGTYHNVDIVSAATVGASSDVSLIGVNSVCLNEQFEVELGGEFLGDIGPCQASSGPAPGPSNASDKE